MKTSKLSIILVIFLLPFVFSCTDNYDFNGRVQLDNDVPNQVNNKSLPCGTGVFEFDYTVNATESLGILEIENKGACNVKVELSRQYPNSASAVRMPTDTVKRGNPKVHVFNIKNPDKLGVVHVKISCLEAESDEGCIFYYKFSTAANTGKKKPKNPSIAVNESRGIVVPGATKPASANKCVTPTGGEKIIKTIKNSSNVDLLLSYTVFSECQCYHFIVYGEPTGKGSKMAKDDPQSTPDRGTKGKAVIPSKKTVNIKVKCDGGSNTNDPCDGKVVEYRLGVK